MELNSVLRPSTKDPARVFPAVALQVKDADMLPPDYLSVASVLFAFAALYLNWKLLAWMACFSLLSSLLTRCNSEFDKMQTILSTIVTVSVLFLLYSPNEAAKVFSSF